VEGVEGWPGDESRLVLDPELVDRIKAIDEYDSLANENNSR